MSFAAGFSLGNRMVGEIEDAKRQKMLDERAAKEFARKEQEWSRADNERASVDRAIGDYQDMMASGQAVAQNSSGFSPASARMLYGQGGQQAVDDAASYANVESARMGLPLTNRTSLPADPAAAPTPTVTMRQATPLDRIRGLEGIALAKKDVASMERLGGQRQLAEEDAFIADAMKSYKGTEDQIGGTASYINANSKRVTMGAPGKNGFVPLSVVGTDGRAEFLNLSKQDQAKLYAAGQLLERNPTRALEIMSSVNKELASAIAQENGLVGKLATNANDVAYKGGQLAVAQQNADTNEAYRRQMADAASARAAGSAGGKGVDAIWAKAEEVAKAGHYGGNVERAYSALKRGQDRGGVQEEATKLEIKLREAGQPEAAIQQQLGAFLVARGLPPASEVARLRSGVGPDGKPLTAEDYASWDRRFPGMPAEDVLGSSPIPSREQLDIIRRDAEANGIKNPTFTWDAGGRTTKGSVKTSSPAASGLPSRMTKPAGNQQGDTPEGAQLDAARAELADFRKSPPGLKAGLAAREEYAKALEEKRAALRQAELQYQRSLAVPIGPYLGLGANSR